MRETIEQFWTTESYAWASGINSYSLVFCLQKTILTKLGLASLWFNHANTATRTLLLV
jgi:hypothetical protein